MSAEETVLINLLDSYWFEYGFFTEKPPLKKKKKKSSFPRSKNRIFQKNIPRIILLSPKSVLTGRSLSELEFEELKGFMDLGFVFRPELEEVKMDKYYNYSRLVSIVPGLQIFRHSRRRDHKNELLDYWKIPAFVNEIDLKNHLRFWAHSVVSTATSS
ncbi:hypothetical protein MIMGU_mgv1a022590mg [Erythranthe guttata]|uniref:Uncharacterized protein n=1 Tax=Erythranthe guttata TaxID=4155 RepID=A0A022QPY3_ERYGU|nr:hypothetical protein MIMGU_mgv1a022590mg [Erythranthe guttata]